MTTINAQGDVIFKAKVRNEDGELDSVEYKGALTLGAMAMIEQKCKERQVFAGENDAPRKLAFWDIVATLGSPDTCSTVLLIIFAVEMINAQGETSITFEEACAARFDFVQVFESIGNALKSVQSEASAKKKALATPK